MAKMFLFVISADMGKINTAVNFASRRAQKGDEIRFLIFGPAETFVAQNDEIIDSIEKVKSDIHPKTCVFIAEQNKIENKFKDKIELLPAGEYISKSIDEGYSIITF